jgi:UDP-GlcNAc:undecaprenyl-phosphate GlcNAc-1-phosphate transferase
MHYLLSFILAMVVTMAGLPLLVRLASRWNIVDLPGGRKVHTTPTPRVGGLAMACGVAAAALLTMQLEGPDRWFLLAADVLVAFGAWDDWADLDYRMKLAGQLLAICVVVVLGDVQIRTITLDDSISLPGWVSVPLTIFFLVGITNAINLTDGLDGLAGGTAFFCLCAVALLLSSVGESGTSTAMALAFAGAVLGFLRFNTYPASVFMGDAGSQLLGFAIGVLSIRATQGATSQISAAIPVLLLALPILDTLNVMRKRIIEGRSPFRADQNHIHHKLLWLGFDHHEAVMVIYAVQGALFVAAYYLRFESDLLILGITMAFFAVSVGIFRAAVLTGWKFRVKAPLEAPAAQFMDALQQPRLLPRWTKAAIAVALAGYAVLIVAETSALSGDLRLLIAALLAAIVGFLIIMRAAPLGVIEKSVLFVTATVLVYLEAVVLHPGRLMSTLGWGAVSVAALATAFRLRLSNDRRFQVTPLDLIVLFMALVVPSLPGTLHLPQGAALAIAKLIIVFYAIEMLVSRTDERAVWVRIATASVLAGLTLRSLAIF